MDGRLIGLSLAILGEYIVSLHSFSVPETTVWMARGLLCHGDGDGFVHASNRNSEWIMLALKAP